ncbi:RDD family protein [Candidatus Sumerlaeota bacterium]|nr:RDD family protein [Candidatus Sumerlaeota bacterium]
MTMNESQQNDEKVWWIFDNVQQRGPFSTDDVRQEILTGVLRRGALVWKQGMADWRAVESVGEFQNFIENQQLRPEPSQPPMTPSETPSVPLPAPPPREPRYSGRIDSPEPDPARRPPDDGWRHEERPNAGMASAAIAPPSTSSVIIRRLLAGFIDLGLITFIAFVILCIGMISIIGLEEVQRLNGLIFTDREAYMTKLQEMNLKILPVQIFAILVSWVLIGLRDAFNGRSLGKLICGLRAVRIDTLESIGLGRSLLRNLTLMLWFAFSFYCCVPVIMFCGEALLLGLLPGVRRLGDLMAGTVVMDERAWRAERERGLHGEY